MRLGHLGTGLALVVLVAPLGGSAHAAKATPAEKCASTKQKLVAKKIGALTACDSQAVQHGTAVAQACVTKVQTTFSDDWTKAEAKGGCATTGDKGNIENKVDTFDTSLQSLLEVSGAASKCTAAKFKEAGTKASCEIHCDAKSASKGTAVDSTCITKCQTKFAAACSKAEKKSDCHTTGDCITVEEQVDAFATDVAAELSATPTMITTH